MRAGASAVQHVDGIGEPLEAAGVGQNVGRIHPESGGPISAVMANSPARSTRSKWPALFASSAMVLSNALVGRPDLARRHVARRDRRARP